MLGADSQRPSASADLLPNAGMASRRKATTTITFQGKEFVCTRENLILGRKIAIVLLLLSYPILRWSGGMYGNVPLLLIGIGCLIFGLVWPIYSTVALFRLAYDQRIIDKEDAARERAMTANVVSFAEQNACGAASIDSGAKLASEDEFRIDLPPPNRS